MGDPAGASLASVRKPLGLPRKMLRERVEC